MNKMKGKKGFTLIELLAVIVVLAIVAVLGAGLVLPALANARKNAFVVEANNAIDAASRAVSYFQIGTVSPTDLTTAGAKHTIYTTQQDATNKEKYCFTLESLVKLGVFDKKDLTNYGGTIIVTVPRSNTTAYTYTTSMHNDRFYTNPAAGVTGSVDASKVEETDNIASVTGIVTTCS